MTGAGLTSAQIAERREAAEATGDLRRVLAGLSDPDLRRLVIAEVQRRARENPSSDLGVLLLAVGEDVARIGWGLIPPDEV